VLDVFLRSRSGPVLALLLAAGLGALHALTPGHGKTMVAAYLVGQRGTVWHAFLLGLVTTVTHTAVVLVLAVVLWLYFGERVPPGVDKVIGLVGGFMVAGLGLWLLTCRLSGRPDHVHFGGGHGHGHGHGDGDGHGHGHGHGHGDHEHDGPPAGVGIGPLIWLGIAGGILPCGDAIALLILTLKEGVPWLGPPLILAFSAGLASVLIAIGVGVVFARRQIDVRSGGSARLRMLARALPLFSAVAVTALGLWMCYDSVRGPK
jgi:ABC-type nickel/cobalt efflux system permease component RcnA